MSPMSHVKVTAMKISTYCEIAGTLPQRTSPVLLGLRYRKMSMAVIDTIASRTEETCGTERPILTLASTRSLISPRWSDDMRAADIVLDVELIARRAVQLGAVVTVVRIAGGLHDLSLSAPQVRARFYAEIDRWLAGYGWG